METCDYHNLPGTKPNSSKLQVKYTGDAHPPKVVFVKLWQEGKQKRRVLNQSAYQTSSCRP